MPNVTVMKHNSDERLSASILDRMLDSALESSEQLAAENVELHRQVKQLQTDLREKLPYRKMFLAALAWGAVTTLVTVWVIEMKIAGAFGAQ